MACDETTLLEGGGSGAVQTEYSLTVGPLLEMGNIYRYSYYSSIHWELDVLKRRRIRSEFQSFSSVADVSISLPVHINASGPCCSFRPRHV